MRRWLGEARRRWDEGPPEPLALVGAVVRAVADRQGLPVDLGVTTDAGTLPDLPAAWCTPRLPGLVYEALVDPADRRARGSWFTPPAVVDRLVDLVLADGFSPSRVLDPACGGGAFLLGVADALHRRGVDAWEAASRLIGVDLDPAALTVARWSLDLWLAGHRCPVGAASLTLGNSLSLELEPVDLVVGNPPFGTPLRAARSASPATVYRRQRHHLGPYADEAACFLDRASTQVGPGGRLVLVLPLSLLNARDAAGVVELLQSEWDLSGLWVPERPVFEASVHVFAPVLHRRIRPGSGERPRVAPLCTDRPVGPPGTAPLRSSWAEAASTALGIPLGPAVQPGTTRRLGELVTATSGFRGHHYGLAAACREAAEAPAGAPVITVGQIGPLHWDRDRPVRFGGRRWSRPVVDVEGLPEWLATWVRRQQRPKLLLATQSRVLEPLIDRTGVLVPSTPVIAVHAAADRLDAVAAVLLAPPVVAWAARRSLGSSLTPTAITLSARHVLEIPLPPECGPWDEAAALLADVDAGSSAGPDLVEAVAALMCRAYRVEDAQLWGWWRQRLDATLPGAGATLSGAAGATPPGAAGATGRIGR